MLLHRSGARDAQSKDELQTVILPRPFKKEPSPGPTRPHSSPSLCARGSHGKVIRLHEWTQMHAL